MLNVGQIPESWNEAFIALIPKEGQDLINIRNYHPVSLLNNDYKIGARVLAARLRNFLVKCINEEQVGFLLARKIKDVKGFYILLKQAQGVVRN